METLEGMDEALRLLLAQERAISVAAVEQIVRQGQRAVLVTEVRVEAVNLAAYDALLTDTLPVQTGGHHA